MGSLAFFGFARSDVHDELGELVPIPGAHAHRTVDRSGDGRRAKPEEGHTPAGTLGLHEESANRTTG